MAPFSPTMAAIRYGYGLAPDQILSRNTDDLLVQLVDAPLKESFFPIGGAFDARQRVDDLAKGFEALKIAKKNNDAETDRAARQQLQRKAEQSFQRDSLCPGCFRRPSHPMGFTSGWPPSGSTISPSMRTNPSRCE